MIAGARETHRTERGRARLLVLLGLFHVFSPANARSEGSDALMLLREKTESAFGRQYEWKVDTLRTVSESEAAAFSVLLGEHLERLSKSASPDAMQIAGFQELKSGSAGAKETRERMEMTARLVSPTLWRVTKSLRLEDLPDPVLTTYIADGTGVCYEVANGMRTVLVHENAREVLAGLLSGPVDLRLLDDLSLLKPEDCLITMRPPRVEVGYFGPRNGVRRKVVFDAKTFDVQSVEDFSDDKLLAMTERKSAKEVEAASFRLDDGSVRRRSFWTLVGEQALQRYADREFEAEIPANYAVQVVGRTGQRITLTPEEVKGRKFSFGP